jgi:hypothetical protein
MWSKLNDIIDSSGKTAENGDSRENPTISCQNKRNRNDDDEEIKDIKKEKMGAV